MVRYFNLKTVYGIETIDEFDSNDFPTFKEYRQELKRLAKEYRMAGMPVYTSQRATKEYSEA